MLNRQQFNVSHVLTLQLNRDVTVKSSLTTLSQRKTRQPQRKRRRRKKKEKKEKEKKKKKKK